MKFSSQLCSRQAYVKAYFIHTCDLTELHRCCAVALPACIRSDATTILIKWLINDLSDGACVMFAKTNFPQPLNFDTLSMKCTNWIRFALDALNCQCVWKIFQCEFSWHISFRVSVGCVFMCIFLMHNLKAHVCLSFFPICHVRACSLYNRHSKVLRDLKMCVNY